MFDPMDKVRDIKLSWLSKDFTQTYGIDYKETFTPVVKLNSIKVLLFVTANLDWNLHQMDLGCGTYIRLTTNT